MITITIALEWLGIFCWQFGMRAQRKSTPAPFFLGFKAPLEKIFSVAAYNKAVSRLWYVYGFCFALAGVFTISYNPYIRWVGGAGVPVLATVCIAILYGVIYKKHSSRQEQ